MAVQLLIGAALGVAVGLALQPKKKKAAATAPAPAPGCLAAPGCGVTEMSAWITARALRGSLVTTEADISAYFPVSQGGQIPDADFAPTSDTVIITQDTCIVYGWDGVGWVQDPDRTADLAQFLETGLAEVEARRARAELSPPTLPPKGVAPPPGERPPPTT